MVIKGHPTFFIYAVKCYTYDTHFAERSYENVVNVFYSSNQQSSLMLGGQDTLKKPEEQTSQWVLEDADYIFCSGVGPHCLKKSHLNSVVKL